MRPTDLTRVLRINLAAEPLAKAIYMSHSEGYLHPALPWSALPVLLRAGLIEYAGRVLLLLGPADTNEALGLAVQTANRQLAQDVAPKAKSRPVLTFPEGEPA